MKSYTINGVLFEYDDSLHYYDFWVNAEGGQLVEMAWDVFLEHISSNKISMEEAKKHLIMMDRWIRDVPRKRFYRGMIKSGASVLSSEFWFDEEPDDEAERIFQGLENTGNVARRFLETFCPDLAKECREDRHHPATKYYLDP